MAIEQIELRLTTFHDLGDTVVTVMPTIGLMKKHENINLPSLCLVQTKSLTTWQKC
ncbi:MAG: hypothetical protein CM1200mP23_1530 [Nitrososphaerota archaeon]|nr:MAG: hypothetical protein CM1200mP23_1530 [Nitrososphaerota archaeon]